MSDKPEYCLANMVVVRKADVRADKVESQWGKGPARPAISEKGNRRINEIHMLAANKALTMNNAYTVDDIVSGKARKEIYSTNISYWKPSSGSYPFRFSKTDAWDTLKHFGKVAVAAVCGELINVTLPSVHSDSALIIFLIPVISTVISAMKDYFTDTRPQEEIKAKPYSEYKVALEAINSTPDIL